MCQYQICFCLKVSEHVHDHVLVQPCSLGSSFCSLCSLELGFLFSVFVDILLIFDQI